MPPSSATSTISDDWRLKGNDWLVHLELTRKPYTQWSEEWDHDHCLFCWAKFMDPNSSAEARAWVADHPEVLTEGYATIGSDDSPADYNWVCSKCFDDFNELMGFTAIDEHGAAVSPIPKPRALRDEELTEMPQALRSIARVHLHLAAWPLDDAFDAVEWFTKNDLPIQALDVYRAMDDGHLRAIDYCDCAPLPGSKSTVTVEETELAAIDALMKIENREAWVAVVLRETPAEASAASN